MRIIIGAIACAALSACGTSDLPNEDAVIEAGKEGLAGATIPVEVSEPGEPSQAAGEPETAQPETPLAAQPVSCQPDETPIFACRVKSGKSAAVCAAEQGAEYRFGKGTSELTLRGGQWGSVAYSGGGEAQIAFENGDTRYIVFSRMIRTNFAPDEPNNPAISDGVIVERAGKVVSVQICDDDDILPVQYEAAEEHLPKAEELFTNETGRADPF